MADAPILTAPGTGAPPTDGGPTIRPRRSLPGGRAVVGAFLVVLAAVGTFGAYLQATSAPDTRWVVATEALDVGEVLTEEDVAERLTTVAIDLPEEQAASAVLATLRSQLVGTVVVAPVAAGDIVNRSAVQSIGSAEQGVQLSFSLPPDRAVAGSVAVGERVDIVGTFDLTTGGGSETRVVARQVAVVAAPAPSDGLGGGRVVLTVQVPDLQTAQAIQYAVDVADIAILRGADPSSADPAPITGDERRVPAPTETQPAPPADLGADADEGAAGTDVSADVSADGGGEA